MGYVLDPHVHGDENSLVRDLRESNHIEGLWGVLKTDIRRNYVIMTGADTWLDFVYEALWRRHWKKLSDFERKGFLIDTWSHAFEANDT